MVKNRMVAHKDTQPANFHKRAYENPKTAPRNGKNGTAVPFVSYRNTI